ncbi:MAG: diacylglycerol/lipid kinase family protein [Lachnospiraceae bacterium]
MAESERTNQQYHNKIEYYFIVNSKSGNSEELVVWDQIERILEHEEISYQVFLTEYVSHATDLCRTITTGLTQRIRLIAVGGDGTVNEVLNGISDFENVEFGYLPTGSGNDLASGMAKKGSIENMLTDILHSSETFTMDLGALFTEDGKRRYFAISSGAGMDAIVCKKALSSKIKWFLNKISLGQLSYMILTIVTLASMPKANVVIKFDQERERIYPELIFAAAMIQKTEGGGIPMAPQADHSDGLFHVCIAYGISKWRALFLLPILALGRHEKIKQIEVIACESFELRSGIDMELHTDGEYAGSGQRMRYQCIKHKLNCIK